SRSSSRASPDPDVDACRAARILAKNPGGTTPALPARVMAAVQLLHALASDVRVDLRGRNVAVAQQQLHDAQVRAVVQQMRRERVANGVRRQLLVDARLLRVALDDVPESLTRHPVAPPGREKIIRLALEQDLAARAAEELAQPVLRLVPERDEPLAVALADDAQHALVQVELAHPEVD